MENKEGYNKTKIGWIPEDWDTKTLGELCTIKGEYGINAPAVDFRKDLPTYLRITDIDANGNFVEENKKSTIFQNYQKYKLEEGDIVFARTGATVGKTYLHNKKNGELVFAGFLIRFRTNPKRLLPYFLKSYTNSQKYWDWINVISMRSGQPGVNAKEYANLLLIPTPEISEQKLIIQCLSTWDRAIHSLTQLILQKQKRKKWLMQVLLTGKKRLPGYSKRWSIIKISDAFIEITKKNDGGNHEPLTISSKLGFMSQRNKFEKVIAGGSLDKYIQIQEGDFSYNKGNSKTYEMGCIFKLEEFESALVPFVYINFRAKNNIDSDFYKHWFINHGLDRQLKAIITSGARGDGLLNVNKKSFFSLKIPYPSLKEQTAIAKVLQTADKEIEILNQKLELLKAQKKGLMQQLLTGRKRLVNPKNEGNA